MIRLIWVIFRIGLVAARSWEGDSGWGCVDSGFRRKDGWGAAGFEVVPWYFDNWVLPTRPYLKLDWIERVIARPVQTEVQRNGRVRFLGFRP